MNEWPVLEKRSRSEKRCGGPGSAMCNVQCTIESKLCHEGDGVEEGGHFSKKANSRRVIIYHAWHAVYGTSSVVCPAPAHSAMLLQNEENDNEKQNGVRTRDCRAIDGTYQQTDKIRCFNKTRRSLSQIFHS